MTIKTPKLPPRITEHLGDEIDMANAVGRDDGSRRLGTVVRKFAGIGDRAVRALRLSDIRRHWSKHVPSGEDQSLELYVARARCTHSLVEAV